MPACGQHCINCDSNLTPQQVEDPKSDVAPFGKLKRNRRHFGERVGVIRTETQSFRRTRAVRRAGTSFAGYFRKVDASHN